MIWEVEYRKDGGQRAIAVPFTRFLITTRRSESFREMSCSPQLPVMVIVWKTPLLSAKLSSGQLSGCADSSHDGEFYKRKAFLQSGSERVQDRVKHLLCSM